MQVRNRQPFSTIRTEGGILPADLLQRIHAGDSSLDGLKPEHYHLAKGEKLSEAISGSWNRLRGVWKSFRKETAEIEAISQLGTAQTRREWLEPLFQELGYGRLLTAKAHEIEGKSYPISHQWQNTPIHLLSFRIDLDRRTAGVAGAAQGSPHSMAQEFLNRSPNHQWGILSNGYKLRILRDNASLTRQAYVEFDLEAMMEGEAYADFTVLWLVCHQSRFEGERPEDCWLEQWSQAAHDEGTRALEALRDGVERAISHLGTGFIAHPENAQLRERLRSGELSRQDYYRQLLRLVYRLIFLFVAEDRDLLLLPDAPGEVRERYNRFYSASRLRELAEKQRGSRHPDLYRGLRVVMGILGSKNGEPKLGLPALGSFLWSGEAVADLDGDIANHDLLDAVRALCFVTQDSTRRAVDYKNLGPEELGSIYESLLELHPVLNLDAASFRLETVAGSERKTTGSYYTPDSLIQSLLDTSLNPLLDEAMRKSDPEQALLDLKVCDPACGSGHFLIAAAHRIAARLASVRTGDDQPSPEAIRHALRDVIGRCIYGVDLNPMAVELCKVNLWLEALEPGKPLSFLDHHIQVGNALLGATPAAIREGIPDDAFKTITGDDTKFANEYKAQNRNFRRQRQRDLFGVEMMPWERLGNVPALMAGLNDLPDDSVEAVQEKQRRYEAAVQSADYANARLLADAWCASFVWKKRPDPEKPYPITEETFRKIERNPHNAPHWMRDEIRRLARQYGFFHWHLAFPDVFRLPAEEESPDNELAGWRGGFSLMLGNPPWERVKLQEKEWFAPYRPDIAGARNKAERDRMIAALRSDDPALYEAFQEARRQAEGESHLLRNSERYPLCGRGDVNTYQVFAELFRTLIAPEGRVGIIVPSGIATDATTQHFFRDLMERRSLVSLYDFENRKAIFPGVHRSYKFCLLTLTGSARPAVRGADFVFFALETGDLRDDDRHFTLTAEEIALLNPNTRTCPIFRSKRDAELTKAIYRRVPVLIEEGPPEKNPWGIKFSTMFHMSNDSHLFRTRDQLEGEGFRLEGNHFVRGGERWLPLYEAKMMHQFDHRFATYDGLDTRAVTGEEKRDADHAVLPRYWVAQREIAKTLDETPHPGWMLAFRKTARATDERTVIVSSVPRVAINDKAPFFLFSEKRTPDVLLLAGNLNAYVCDFSARQKVGATDISHFYMKQFPLLAPESYDNSCPWSAGESMNGWLLPRVLELTYTAWDLEAFARDCGYDGPPFRWNSKRRTLLRAELDAAFFHLYGIERDDVDYIMETFPIVKRKDEQRHGSYRTKELILRCYDAMERAIETGEPYQTLLNPPPAHPSVAHPPREAEEEAPLRLVVDNRPAEPTANPYFRRAVLAAEIAHQLHQSPTFGRVKFQKLLYLCEHAAGLEDLKSNYQRAAAGPFDNTMMRSVDSQLRKAKWFQPVKGEKGTRYVPLPKAGDHRKYYERYWGQQHDAIQRLIDLLGPLRSKQCEVIATLHSAWNDLLAEGRTVDDDAIIREATEHWHESKKQITPEQWTWGLNWLRKNDLVPQGKRLASA